MPVIACQMNLFSLNNDVNIVEDNNVIETISVPCVEVPERIAEIAMSKNINTVYLSAPMQADDWKDSIKARVQRQYSLLSYGSSELNINFI